MDFSIKLHTQFIKGLKQYGLTPEDIKKNWKYCGGDTGSHKKYFENTCGNESLSEHFTECVCGHNIKENCYLTDGERILVLGNCCIKRFCPKSTRTCEKCSEPHKNRKNNYCKECRKILKKEEKERIEKEQYRKDNEKIYFDVPYEEYYDANILLGAKFDRDVKCAYWLRKDYRKVRKEVKKKWKIVFGFIK